MRLTGMEIKRFVESYNYRARIGPELEEKRILIKPFHENQLNPNSYNLRLADTLLTYRSRSEDSLLDQIEHVLDPRRDNPTEQIKIPDSGLVLKPGRLYLGSTVEWTETHGGIIPQINGRSSLGRLGLWVHITAGFGDSGFCGHWTLELACVQPIRIYAGMEICQISFELSTGLVVPYQGKYQDAQGVESSKYYKEALLCETCETLEICKRDGCMLKRCQEADADPFFPKVKPFDALKVEQ